MAESMLVVNLKPYDSNWHRMAHFREAERESVCPYLLNGKSSFPLNRDTQTRDSFFQYAFSDVETVEF
jgi:hypothetical protein